MKNNETHRIEDLTEVKESGSWLSQFDPSIHEHEKILGGGRQDLMKECEEDPRSIQPMFKTSAGDLVVRALTLAETYLMIAKNFITYKNEDGSRRKLEERVPFGFCNWGTDTCSGFAYEGGSTKFLFADKCEQLITPDKILEEKRLIPINYQEFKENVGGIEFDSRDPMFGKKVEYDDFMEHGFWSVVFPDLEVRECVRDSIFKAYKLSDYTQGNLRLEHRMKYNKKWEDTMKTSKALMAVYPLPSPEQDQLISASVMGLRSKAYIEAAHYLGDRSNFIRVVQK